MSGGEPACFNLPVGDAVTAYVALGTNVGDKQHNLTDAITRLARMVRIDDVSSVYESAPVGFEQQSDFWNMVVAISTDLPARQLMDELIAIETAMGRVRTFRNAPRIIDLDILLYDDVVMNDEQLQIPHPRIAERLFVLRPLLEIAPDVRDPRTKQRYADAMKHAPPLRVEIAAPPIRIEHEKS